MPLLTRALILSGLISLLKVRLERLERVLKPIPMPMPIPAFGRLPLFEELEGANEIVGRAEGRLVGL
jgi:hypothetical protein